jgi:hypothetical protein
VTQFSVIKILAALNMKWATYRSRSRTAPLSKTGRNGDIPYTSEFIHTLIFS